MALTIIILLAVELGGLAVVYVVLRERLRRAATAAAQSQELRDEVSRMVVELNQTTERNVALVEEAIARLNEAIARADKKIGMLRRDTERHDGARDAYARLAERRPAAAGPSRAAAPAVAPAAAPVDPRAEAARLARLGFAAAIIARRVGLPLGEVELITRLAGGPGLPDAEDAPPWGEPGEEQGDTE